MVLANAGLLSQALCNEMPRTQTQFQEIGCCLLLFMHLDCTVAHTIMHKHVNPRKEQPCTKLCPPSYCCCSSRRLHNCTPIQGTHFGSAGTRTPL